MNIERVRMKEAFEVIDIIDEFDAYPTLLGIDWAFDNNVELNMKKRKISLETDTLHVVLPLDLNEGDNYNERVNVDAYRSVIENLY